VMDGLRFSPDQTGNGRGTYDEASEIPRYPSISQARVELRCPKTS
jgi:hypothetical protein